MINELIKLATHLDSQGYHGEADYIDSVIKKLSSDPAEPEEMGELIRLDEYKERKGISSKQNRERIDPEKLKEEWQILQDALNDFRENKQEYNDDLGYNFLIVFEDGETYSPDASIVRVTAEEQRRIEEGEKVYNVVDPDHLSDQAKWVDVWDIVKLEDLQ